MSLQSTYFSWLFIFKALIKKSYQLICTSTLSRASKIEICGAWKFVRLNTWLGTHPTPCNFMLHKNNQGLCCILHILSDFVHHKTKYTVLWIQELEVQYSCVTSFIKITASRMEVTNLQHSLKNSLLPVISTSFCSLHSEQFV